MERQSAGNDKRQGTTNGGERRTTGNNEGRGMTTNEQQHEPPPSLQTRDGGAISFLFLFLFQNFILVTLHRCEQLLAGCLYLFHIHN